MQKIVFNGHYLTYIDTAIAEYWREIGLPYPQGYVERYGSDVYLRKATVEYLGSARYDDVLDGLLPGRQARPLQHDASSSRSTAKREDRRWSPPSWSTSTPIPPDEGRRRCPRTCARACCATSASRRRHDVVGGLQGRRARRAGPPYLHRGGDRRLRPAVTIRSRSTSTRRRRSRVAVRRADRERLADLRGRHAPDGRAATSAARSASARRASRTSAGSSRCAPATRSPTRASSLESRASTTRKGVGLVKHRWEAVNQARRAVLTMEGWGMYGRRPAHERAHRAQPQDPRPHQEGGARHRARAGQGGRSCSTSCSPPPPW